MSPDGLLRISIDEVSLLLRHLSTEITPLFYSHSLIESKLRTERSMELALAAPRYRRLSQDVEGGYNFGARRRKSRKWNYPFD